MPVSSPRARARVANAQAGAAIAENFDGDERLYDAFAAVCAGQFPIDVREGQASCRSGDLAALHRVAHTLKSALILLGESELADLATGVERDAEAGARDAASRGWRALGPALRTWRPRR